ncbi:MAG: hypothetical protein GY859_16295 [Desulfobacterales bacterium]|nr:hypothetical protein [Desulfobacterales bacterium]
MNKIYIITLVVLSILLAGQVGATPISYTYTLDVAIPDEGVIDNIENKIGGVEFTVNGGAYGSDWTATLGNAIPTGGNWIFENYGGSWSAAYDDYDYTLKDYAPMQAGNILTIHSTEELSFGNLGFYDFTGGDVNTAYYQTEGFEAVPIPAAAWLLGGGLVFLVGLKRNRYHEH